MSENPYCGLRSVYVVPTAAEAMATTAEAIDFYQVDSFTSVTFCGAPAGVCIWGPGSEWPKVVTYTYCSVTNIFNKDFKLKG